jgi:hypothetical protein
MLLFEKPCHTYCVSLVQRNIVGLPPPFGKFLQRELHLRQANLGFPFSTTQVQRIIDLLS